MGLSLKTPVPRSFRVNLRTSCCRPPYSDSIDPTAGEVEDRGSRRRRVVVREGVRDGFEKVIATSFGDQVPTDVTNQVPPTC